MRIDTCSSPVSPSSPAPPSATDSAFGVEEPPRIDFISELPGEVAVHIFSFIASLSTVATALRVCRRWSVLANDPEIWRAQYLSRWPPSPHSSPTHPHSTESLRETNGGVDEGDDEIQELHQSVAISLSLQKDWRRICMQRVALGGNWRSGRCHTSAYVGHDDAVYCIQFDGRRIVSGSRDRSVKFWTVRETGFRELRAYRGHDGSVLCLQYSPRRLVTGSSDTTIIVWDFKTGERVHVLRGHAAPVLDVRFDESRGWVVSCSKDMTIRVWDLVTGTLLRVMEGHQAAVNAVHLNGDLVASASGDCLVKLWNVRTGAHIRDFVGHTRGLACVQFTGQVIVSGSNDRTIKVWNSETGECVRTLTGHTELVRTLCFDDERIVSGGYDQTVKLWDFKTGELLHSFKGVHNSWVFHVQMDKCRIVSASQDRKIAVWDFAKGLDLAHEFI